MYNFEIIKKVSKDIPEKFKNLMDKFLSTLGFFTDEEVEKQTMLEKYGILIKNWNSVKVLLLEKKVLEKRLQIAIMDNNLLEQIKTNPLLLANGDLFIENVLKEDVKPVETAIKPSLNDNIISIDSINFTKEVTEEDKLEKEYGQIDKKDDFSALNYEIPTYEPPALDVYEVLNKPRVKDLGPDTITDYYRISALSDRVIEAFKPIFYIDQNYQGSIGNSIVKLVVEKKYDDKTILESAFAFNIRAIIGEENLNKLNEVIASVLEEEKTRGNL